MKQPQTITEPKNKRPCQGTWLFCFINRLKIYAFSKIFPLVDATIGAFYWLFLWNFKKSRINRFLWHGLLQKAMSWDAVFHLHSMPKIQAFSSIFRWRTLCLRLILGSSWDIHFCNENRISTIWNSKWFLENHQKGNRLSSVGAPRNEASTISYNTALRNNAAKPHPNRPLQHSISL